MKNKLLLSLELIIGFILLPLAYYLGLFSDMKRVSFLLLLSLYFILIIVTHKSTFQPKEIFKLPKIKRKDFQIIIGRFLIFAILVSLYMYFFERENFLYIPLNVFPLWILIMIFYPIISAFTQELIYRYFFLKRYSSIFPNEKILIGVNILLFSMLHIIYENPVAVILTLFGGALFAYTYKKYNSTLLVAFEHALYGNFIFTIGLGFYFYKPY